MFKFLTRRSVLFFDLEKNRKLCPGKKPVDIEQLSPPELILL